MSCALGIVSRKDNRPDCRATNAFIFLNYAIDVDRLNLLFSIMKFTSIAEIHCFHKELHVDRRNSEAREASLREKARDRAAFETELRPKLEARRKAALAAGHFGHGFAKDGRPKLHSGYAHFRLD